MPVLIVDHLYKEYFMVLNSSAFFSILIRNVFFIFFYSIYIILHKLISRDSERVLDINSLKFLHKQCFFDFTLLAQIYSFHLGFITLFLKRGTVIEQYPTTAKNVFYSPKILHFNEYKKYRYFSFRQVHGFFYFTAFFYRYKI